MAITLTIAGVDRTAYVGSGTMKIRRTLNQRASADLELRPGTSGYEPVVGNSVYSFLDATKVFGGFIYSIKKLVEPGTSILKIQCRCLDWSYICDRRIVKEDFEATSPAGDVSDIIIEIVSRFLSGEGITTNNVSAGYGLAANLPFKNRPVSECFDRISALTGWQWFIDADKDLHFGPFTTSPVSAAPFGLTATSRNWFDLNATQSLEHYRNVQIVQTENQIEVAAVDSWQMYDAGDDVFWYPTSGKIGSIPIVKVNGVAKTVSTIFPNTRPFPGTHDFYIYDPNETVDGEGLYGIYVDDVNDWTSSDVLTIEYGSQYLNAVTRLNQSEIDARAAIEGGSGRHEAVEDQRDLDSQIALAAYADGLLRQYGSLPTKIEFKTRSLYGLLSPGQSISIVYAPLGLNDTYLIESVDYQWIAAREDFFACTVRCSDQEFFGRATRVLERIVSMARISQSAAAATGTASIDRFKVTFLLLDAELAVDITQENPYRIDDLDTGEEILWESWSIEADVIPTGASLIVAVESSTDYSGWWPLTTATLTAGSRAGRGTTFNSPPMTSAPDDYLRARVTQIGSSVAGGKIRVVVEGKVQRIE